MRREWLAVVGLGLVCCGPHLSVGNGVNAVSPTPSASSVVVLPSVLPHSPPPAGPAPELGLWAVFGAPERDLARLGTLAPSIERELLQVPAGFRDTLGPGIGPELDLSRPAFVAAGNDVDKHLVFSVPLASSSFGSNLPASLTLKPKAAGVESLVVKEGEDHPWISGSTSCEIHRDAPPNGVLVCAPNPEGLDVLGSYVARASAGAPPFPSLYIEARSNLVKMAVSDADPPWQSLVADLGEGFASTSWSAAFAGTDLNIEQAWTFDDTSTPFAQWLAARRVSGVKRPPEFPEAPPDSLFALSLMGVDAQVPRVGRGPSHLASPLEQMFSGSFNALLSVSSLGPIAVAYGLDLPAAQRRLAAWVAADAKYQGSAPPGSFEPVHDWLLYRLEGVSLKSLTPSLAKALGVDLSVAERRVSQANIARPSPAAVELVSLVAQDGLPKGSLHLRVALPDTDPFHILVFPAERSVLVAVSHGLDSARAAARGALSTQKASPFAGYFRAADANKVAGLGFARPEVFAASALKYESSYNRGESLAKLNDLLKAPERKAPPLGITYQIEAVGKSGSRGKFTTTLPKASANLWLPEFLEALDL